MRKKLRFFLFICLSAIQGCNDSSERANEYLESAKSLYQQENYIEAELDLKNALQINNKLADAYYYLALIDEKSHRWRRMFVNLSNAAKLDQSNLDIKLKLAKLLLLSGKLDQAGTLIDEVMHAEPNNPDGLTLRGSIFLKKGQLDLAMNDANNVIQVDPRHVDGISLKIATYTATKDFISAEKTANDAISIQPSELAFYLLKLHLHQQNDDTVAIENDYQEIIENFPDKLEFNYLLAKFYSENGKNDKALELLQKASEQNPEELKPKLKLIDYLLINEPKQAEELINTLINQYPQETDLYFRLAQLHILQNRYDLAETPITWIIENNIDQKAGLDAKILLAKLAIQTEKNDRAIKLVEEVLQQDRSHAEALLVQARIGLIKGNYDDSIAQLRNFLRDYPNSDEAMVLLAKAYVNKNAPELAEENFRKALEVNPGNFSAVMPVVNRMMVSKDITRAEQVLQKALLAKPDHAGALQALAQVRLLKQDWLGTQQVADLISTKPKGVGFSKYLGGKISQGQGMCEEAVTKYKSALAESPGLFDALRSMMICYEELHQRPEMFAYLDLYMSENKDKYYPYIIKSQLYIFKKEWDQALAVLTQAIEQWPEIPQLYEAMAKVFAAQNQTSNVITTYERGLQHIPRNTRLRVMLASTYQDNKDFNKALENYEEVIREKPDVDYAVNNLVSLLFDHYPTKENISRAIKLAQRFENSKNPYYLDTYGWSLYEMEKYEEALGVFQAVVSKMPEIPIFRYHLGLAFYKLNQLPSSKLELEQALTLGKEGNFDERQKVEDLLLEIKSGST